ncbi:MAG: hypothetical protein LBD93_10485 [Treponema sp.]|jgi:ABC-type antimicrobial peptide transport system ATPase subunit|nr:hypothetical protein [Treponema sp.]
MNLKLTLSPILTRLPLGFHIGTGSGALRKIMDKIIVLDKGRISGEGRHEELIAWNKLYEKLYRLQQGMTETGTA